MACDSSEGGIYTDSLERLDAVAAPIDGHELATGLMLVRASTLKVIRLQLAIERRDRRGVLEAVDELVELDSRLQDCLAGVPAFSDLTVLKRQLEAERSSLNREKLTLVSGVTGRADQAERPPSERPCFAFDEAGTAGAPRVQIEDSFAMPIPLGDSAARAEPPRRSFGWVALLLIAVTVCVVEATLFGNSETVARLVAATGAFR